jgi:DNA-directed RNA polymerase subunit RPC12/RpoP
MTSQLKDKPYYEGRYDRQTVEIGKTEVQFLLKSWEEAKDLPELQSKNDQYRVDFWWERLYWWLFEIPVLLKRYEEREQTIDNWMWEDKQRDERIEMTRPRTEHQCSQCNKQGLRLNSKLLMHRENAELVLFMFKCPSCKTKSAFWEDGIEFETKPIPCPHCDGELDMRVSERGAMITTTYTCASCGYREVEKLDVSKPHTEAVDQNYEKFKATFCLSDERAELMQAYRLKWEAARRMMEEEMEKESKKDIYDVVSQIKIMKIADLIQTLQPPIEKAGFIEVRFEKPVLGPQVTIEFSCLDKDTARTDSRSRATLKRAVTIGLKGTNWRLMSTGISYRLGYLSGTVKAYEDESDLVKLVEQEKRT